MSHSEETEEARLCGPREAEAQSPELQRADSPGLDTTEDSSCSTDSLELYRRRKVSWKRKSDHSQGRINAKKRLLSTLDFTGSYSSEDKDVRADDADRLDFTSSSEDEDGGARCSVLAQSSRCPPDFFSSSVEEDAGDGDVVQSADRQKREKM